MPRPIIIGGPDYTQADKSPAAWLRSAGGRAASRVPYGGLSGVLRWLAARRSLQALLWHKELGTLDQLRSLASTAVDWPAARRRHLLSSTKGSWVALRLSAAEAASWEGLQTWFCLEGLERLRETMEMERGAILLASHFGSGHFFPIVLLKLGFELCSLHRDDLFKHLPADLAGRLHVLWIDESFPARALLEAKRRLQDGALVQMVGDGRLGKSGIELEFLGRRWRFPSSHAALAVSTGVPVFPVMAPMNEHGTTTLQVHAPLDRGDVNRPLDAQIQRMVTDYARLLERYWVNDPGNVHFYKLSQFLSQSHR